MDLNGFEFLLNGFEWIWWRVVSGEGLGGWVWVVVRGWVKHIKCVIWNSPGDPSDPPDPTDLGP